MPLAKCPRCAKLFDKREDMRVCAACLTDEESDYEKIRNALEQHPNSNAEQVALWSGVALEVVHRMIDSDRITVLIPGETDFKCGRCGAPAISPTKKLCQRCLDELNREVAKAQSQTRLGPKKKLEIGRFSSNIRQHIEERRK